MNSFAQAPARLPHRADVNGNPVDKQFMRLTHIYEEDEVWKPNADLHNLGARLGDERLGSGFRAPPNAAGPPRLARLGPRAAPGPRPAPAPGGAKPPGGAEPTDIEPFDF